MCDDVIPKDIEVFLNHRTQIFAECLHVLNKVRVDIILQTANAIVVLNETSTRSFLHDIQHMLTVTHAIKECGQRTQVLCTGAEEQQVVVNTLKFIHDGADILNAV